MCLYGLDFTCAPKPLEPIPCAVCTLESGVLHFENNQQLVCFDDFDKFLNAPGPCAAGFDFPFVQKRRLIGALGWSEDWRSIQAYTCLYFLGTSQVVRPFPG